MPSYWLVFYCDICKVSLKYFYLRHFKLNFFYITLHYKKANAKIRVVTAF